MENSIIGRGGGSAMSNSIIQKNTVYFNTRPLFKAKKKLIFFKIFHNFGQKGGGKGGFRPIMEFSIIFFIYLKCNQCFNLWGGIGICYIFHKHGLKWLNIPLRRKRVR